MCEWKDGPGKLSYPETVSVKAIRLSESTPGMSRKHVRMSFEVFGSHVEVYWNIEDDEITWRNQRNLSDGQKKYLTFLTKLWAITSYKDLRA
jgi:hypothetical protein